MEHVITTDKLSKRFRDKVAVDRLDLAIPAGAIFALLGDNGAGKSTTIRMLTGQLEPDTGSSRILGQDAWANAVALRRRVGYVPERPRFYDWMTVHEIGGFVAGFHTSSYGGHY
jgi:ABC-2 type transport system ATP-binding protein